MAFTILKNNLKTKEIAPEDFSGPVYRVENLTKRYGKKSKNEKKGDLSQEVLANSGISLEIEPGEVFGLLGSNGAGKSTLIRQMVNLVAPTSGKISLFGNDIARRPGTVTRYVGYMPQKPQALLDLTPEEAIYFTGHLRGMSRPEAKKAAARLVEEWGLEEVRTKAVRHLSGGQHRLVGLAITLVGDLPVMILDEPTNELDPAFRRQVWDRLSSLHRSQGTTIILVTHNVQEAERVIDRVAIMSLGKVVGLGRVGELKEQIDRSIRLELFIKPGRVAEVEPHLKEVAGAVSVGQAHWKILVPRQGAEDSIHRILSAVQLERLEDFRVHTTTLEDVYLSLTGHTISEAGEE